MGGEEEVQGDRESEEEGKKGTGKVPPADKKEYKTEEQGSFISFY